MNLPRVIFVKQEDNDGDPFLVASDDAADMIDVVGEEVPVGVYVLQTVATARANVEVK